MAYVFVSALTLKKVLGNDFFQQTCVHGIEYPVQKWTPEHDEEMMEGAMFHTMVYEEILRPEFQQIMKNLVFANI